MQGMKNYLVHIEVESGELEKTMEELNKAQETIRECYYKLAEMGVLTVREKTEAASGN